MICSGCQHYNRDGLDFCTNCGEKIESNKCANGHSIPAGVAECPYCPTTGGRKKTVQEVGGQGAPGAASAGPRKTVMVGDNEIQEQLSNAPTPQRSAAPGAGRSSKTVYAPPNGGDGPAAARSAVAAPFLGGQRASSGSSKLIGFLVSYSSDPNGVFWPLRFGRVRIGSEKQLADIHLDHGEISGDHVVINSRANKGATKIWCTDSNSVNGTKLNGDDIFNDRPDLKHGDVLGIGPFELTLVLVDR